MLRLYLWVLCRRWDIVVDCKSGVGALLPAKERYWRYPSGVNKGLSAQIRSVDRLSTNTGYVAVLWAV